MAPHETAPPTDTAPPQLQLTVTSPTGPVEATVIWFDDVEVRHSTDAEGQLTLDVTETGVLFVLAGDLVPVHFYAGGLSGEHTLLLPEPTHDGCGLDPQGEGEYSCGQLDELPGAAAPIYAFGVLAFGAVSIAAPDEDLYAPTPDGWVIVRPTDGRIELGDATTLAALR